MTLPRIIPAVGTSPFIRDYIAGTPALAPFYTGHPSDPTAYERKSREVRDRMDPAARARVAEAYRPLNDAARKKLDRILRGDGFVVTTGQQAGLFTGPLYTIYKALSAVRLAAALEQQLKCPVLALFWVAADDHDWAEVDHVRVLDAYDYPRDVRVRSDVDAPPWPMSRKRLGAGVTAAIDELAQLLPPDGFGDDLRSMLRRAYTADRTVASAFEDMIAEILAPFPIAIVSSAHPAIKRASLPVMLHELVHAEAHEQIVAAQTARLSAAGYPPQVVLTPDASNVFLLRDAGRDRLLRERGAWLLRRTGERVDPSALLEQANTDPEILSANVFLRPIVESSVFPTLAYVGGPAETAYFAQIGCLFEAHNIKMPVIFPRHGLTVIEARADRTLERMGYDVESVRGPFAKVVSALVKAELPPSVRDALGALGDDLGNAYAALESSIPAVDPTLAGPVRSSRYRASLEVRRMEKQIERQFKARNADRIEQLRRAASSIHPDGAPQERVLNIVPLLAKYGPPIVQAMHDAMPVALDRSMPEWSGVNCDNDQGAT
ncbi:MAG: bacillithiol biosynthesis cysteine-adding enzyme BshC [Longimicrobiales bacterium]